MPSPRRSPQLCCGSFPRPKMRFLSTGSTTIRYLNFTHNLTHINRVLVIPCSDLAAPERI